MCDFDIVEEMISSNDAKISSVERKPFLLGDKEIREALKARLTRSFPAPKAVLEELRVCNGNAIADVVAVHSDTHCYEIKSDKDSVERINKQSKFYDQVFRKVTLVTTTRHAARALKFAPDHWGILVATLSENGMSFSYARSASANKYFNKSLALMTLWRAELDVLIDQIPEINSKKLSRKGIAEILADNFSVEKTSKEIGSQLIFRSTRVIDH